MGGSVWSGHVAHATPDRRLRRPGIFIKPATVGRKNWQFADTPKGAKASAAIYSIIETAKANGINVRDYLEYLFTVMPTEDWRKDPEMLESLTPCSPEIRKKFKNRLSHSIGVRGRHHIIKRLPAIVL